MPEYNALQTSRLDKWVRKLLGIRNGGVMPTVAPELGVALNVPMLEDGMLPAGYEPFGIGTFVAAVAAQNAFVSVINGYTDALVILRFWASAGGASGWDVALGAGIGAPGIAVNNTSVRDLRRAQSSLPLGATTLNVAAGTQALAVPPVGHQRVWSAPANLASSPWVVLAPSSGATCYATVVNIALYCSVEGYIRHVDPDELTA